MGASYYAYAVIGVEVTDRLHTVTRKFLCEHRPSGAFCSTCGKPNKLVDIKTPIAGYDEDRGTIGDLSVVHTTGQQKSFCGIVVKTGDLGYGHENHKLLALAPSQATRIDELRNKLTELGLWDEASFGLWAVGYCSY